MTWTHNDVEITSLPDNCVGFVYLITNIRTGRKYVGKKLATKAKTSIIKGKKKRSRVESDWQNYYGSSPELTEDVKSLGKETFKREILHICDSKALCSYLEAKEQFTREVIEKPDEYYNGWIMVRVNRKHIIKDSNVKQVKETRSKGKPSSAPKTSRRKVKEETPKGD